jgi:2-polyprenyl-6-methoxyphenol hydroxylase-like FAD-dependent oxidoreductase
MDRAPTTTPVAIVGGGPVGLLLALFLDRHGVRSTVFDTSVTTSAQPRGSTHNARTMEHYRRLGLAGQVRRLGAPWDHETDIVFFTRYNGYELARLRHPGPSDVLRAVAAADRIDQTPEPMHRANQAFVERMLFEHARTRPGITLCFGRRVVALDERAGHVVLTSEGDDGRSTCLAGYVAGCDGGRSFVRRTVRIGYSGHSTLDQDVLGRRATAAHLRVPGLYRDLIGQGRRAWSHWVFNGELALNLIAVNGKDEYFLLSSSLNPDTVDDGDVVELVRRAAGVPIEVDVLSRRVWTPGAALVADRFGTDRVLLAGDAAHLFTPNGGFGMNTGVDDAANLAWKLAAAVQGWAGAKLLGSYELERRPIAERNTEAAREFNIRLGAVPRPARIEEDSLAGLAVRAQVGAALADYGRLTLDTIGVQLGARYDGSPLVDSGGAGAPPDSLRTYTPTSVPGGRAPHAWLDDVHGPHSSLFDRFGTGFTLLRLGAHAPTGGDLCRAALDRHIPLTVVTVTDPVVRDLYARDLVLIRPDQHVAWRGNALPDRPDELLAMATGR